MTSKEEIQEFINDIKPATPLIRRANINIAKTIDMLERAVKDLETLEILQNKLTEYEALEEQGRLIKLPCAVGDKIYIVSYPYFSTDEIKKISVNYETRTESIKEYQIGTYAFFDKKEAETLFEQIKEGLENR